MLSTQERVPIRQYLAEQARPKVLPKVDWLYPYLSEEGRAKLAQEHEIEVKLALN